MFIEKYNFVENKQSLALINSEIKNGTNKVNRYNMFFNRILVFTPEIQLIFTYYNMNVQLNMAAIN